MTQMKFSIAVLAVSAVLTLPEIVAAQRKADSGGLFSRLDKNGDGLLAADEMSGERKELFDRLVRRGDKNDDGKLTSEEFLAAVKNRGGVARPDRREGRGLNRPRPSQTQGAPPSQRSRSRASSGFGRSAPKIGDSLPEVSAFDAEGKEFNLSSLKGHYTVLVFGCLT